MSRFALAFVFGAAVLVGGHAMAKTHTATTAGVTVELGDGWITMERGGMFMARKGKVGLMLNKTPEKTLAEAEKAARATEAKIVPGGKLGKSAPAKVGPFAGIMMAAEGQAPKEAGGFKVSGRIYLFTVSPGHIGMAMLMGPTVDFTKLGAEGDAIIKSIKRAATPAKKPKN